MLALFFTACVLFIIALIALDLGVFHRRSHEHVVGMREALAWTSVWFTLALCFNVAVYFLYGANWLGFRYHYETALTGGEAAGQFLAGYLLELSLSMDNLFVFATILAYFRVPLNLQHRVLVWGILGAIFLRGVMIFIGVELVERFDWIFYVFGGLLLLTAIRMLMPGSDQIQPERNIFIRLARKLYPVTHELHGSRFFTRIDGVLHMTPLFLALILVDIADVVFAVDSIPAIIGVTQDRFLVYTSNIFAIMGLRSMYFALVGLADRFHYVKPAIIVLLAFIGVKMVLHHHLHISTGWSLAVIGVVLAIGVLASILFSRAPHRPAEAPGSSRSMLEGTERE
jgi:tellurite resistance protein TerC